VKIVAFYNPKAGVGCTSLVYHLAWMYRELGLRVLVVDADPQGDLSGMFLGFEDYVLEKFSEESVSGSIGAAMLHGVTRGAEYVRSIDDGLGIVIGDSSLEDWIEEETDARELWRRGARGRGRSLDDVKLARMRRLFVFGGAAMGADLVLVDAGAGLGVCPCLACVSCDAVVVPVTGDDPAVDGMKEGGHALGSWALKWRMFVDGVVTSQGEEKKSSQIDGMVLLEELERLTAADATWLGEDLVPLGYVVLGEAHYAGFSIKPGAALREIPRSYAVAYERMGDVVDERNPPVEVSRDKHCLGVLRRYVSLRGMSLQARKPMFALTPADGALGSMAVAVQRCRAEYEGLAREIAERLGVPVQRD